MHSFQSTDWEDFLFFLSLIVGSYLGQNFLTDTKVRHRIADKVKNLYQQWNVEAIIEI
ncbi:MAG: hypothetical protein LBD11_02690 [Candidatus Peribacteria bacterium]|jgi:hypothetical protein|nr:hypothetical protein [Candidatus Peribacteria bacterium]